MKKCEFWIGNGANGVQERREQPDVAVRQPPPEQEDRQTIVPRSKSADEHAAARL